MSEGPTSDKQNSFESSNYYAPLASTTQSPDDDNAWAEADMLMLEFNAPQETESPSGSNP